MSGRVWQPGIEILFEDDDLIAVVKPAGLPTANVPADRPSLFTWLGDRFGPGAFVGIVSRLDAAVSGVVVAAKTPASAAGLAEQFRERTVTKQYAAVVTGRFPAALGEWREWTDRLARGADRQPSEILVAGPPAPGRRQGRGAGGPPGQAGQPEEQVQEATTRARVVHRAGEVSLVELQPLTGRRHQLRAQLAGRGCPIVGDRLYGSRLPFPLPGGIALHAVGLSLVHPATGAGLSFATPRGAGWEAAFPSLFPGKPAR